MSDVTNQQLLEVAIAASKAGSNVLVEQYEKYFGDHATEELDIKTKTAPNDLVTETDQLTQEAIIAEIQKKFPDHQFIAEEKGADKLGDPNSPYAWIIDPLDGTMNFTRGRKNFGTIIAVQKDDHLIAGSMRLPYMELEFHGARDIGAFYNDKPVRLRSTNGMLDAVLCTNTIRRAVKDDHGNLVVPTPPCGSLENTGCAAEEIGLVLMGHTDGAFFKDIRIWDIAAGFLMIEIAGGNMRYEFMEPGNARGGFLCAASTAPIFDDLWEFTQKLA